MPNTNKTLTGSALTYTTKTSFISDQYSLPSPLKIADGSVKSAKRSKTL